MWFSKPIPSVSKNQTAFCMQTVADHPEDTGSIRIVQHNKTATSTASPRRSFPKRCSQEDLPEQKSSPGILWGVASSSYHRLERKESGLGHLRALVLLWGGEPAIGSLLEFHDLSSPQGISTPRLLADDSSHGDDFESSPPTGRAGFRCQAESVVLRNGERLSG